MILGFIGRPTRDRFEDVGVSPDSFRHLSRLADLSAYPERMPAVPAGNGALGSIAGVNGNGNAKSRNGGQPQRRCGGEKSKEGSSAWSSWPRCGVGTKSYDNLSPLCGRRSTVMAIQSWDSGSPGRLTKWRAQTLSAIFGNVQAEHSHSTITNTTMPRSPKGDFESLNPQATVTTKRRQVWS